MNRLLFALALAPSVALAQGPGTTLQYTSPAGKKYYSQKDTGGIARAQAAVKRNANNPDTLVALGLQQATVWQMHEAIGSFTKAIQLAPSNAVAYRWRGHRYLSIRQLDSAFKDLTKATQLDSTIYGGWYHLGIVHFLRGEFAAAAAAFGTARPHAPNDDEYVGSTDWWWMSAMRAGQPATALRAIETMKTDSLNLDHGKAYMQRIRMYKGQLQPTQVLSPSDTAAVDVATLAFGVGNWYLVKGDTAKAKEYFHRATAGTGWAAFGFMASERELARLEHRAGR